MKHALVTGANRGIGLELCRLLVKRGEAVVAVCRSSSPELEQLTDGAQGTVQVEANVDITSDEDVAALAGRVRSRCLDLLVNNAGLLLPGEPIDDLDFDGIRQQFEINAIGALRVTRALLGKLERGSKLALVTSRMGSIGDNTSGSRYGYRMSKAALNMAGVSLAHDLRPRGVAVAILHPGFVRTGMTGGRGDVAADRAARGLLARIDELSLLSTGGFWHANGDRLPW